MGFIKDIKDGLSGSWKAPAQDLYSRYATGGMFGDTSKNIIMPGVTASEKTRLEGIPEYVSEKTGMSCELPQHIIEDVYSMYANENFKRKETTSGNTVRQKIIDRVYNSLTKTVTQGSPLFSQIVTQEMAVYMNAVYKELEEEIKQEQEQEKKQTNSPAGNCDQAAGVGESDSDEEGNPGEGNPSGADKPDNQGQNGQQGSNQQQGKEEGDNSDDSSDKQGDTNNAGSGSNKSGHGDDDIDQQKVDDALNNLDTLLQKAQKDASDKMKDIEDKLGKKALQDLSNNDPDFLDNYENIKNVLKQVSINKESIEKVLKKILNKSENYFSKKHHTIEESLFDCEACEDLYGLEYLAPMFKNAELMNIVNEKKVYTGKIDLYLDCSYSMNDREEFDGKSIRMCDLVKGIALVLYKMGMIENLYFFDDDLYHVKNVNEMTILAFDKTGGTNFSKVVQQIIQNQENAVVITDGCDNVDKYVKEAFWIGIGKYANFQNNGFDTYRKMRQCAAYEPNKNVFEYCK